MPTAPAQELIDRLIDVHFDTHPNERHAYHTDAAFHAGVTIIREFLYTTYEGCRHAGVSYDRASDLLIYLITSTVDAKAYTDAAAHRG